MLFIFSLLTILRVAFVGDPQVDNGKELQYARQSIYSELRGRNDLDLVVVLGDLVNEKPELIAPSEASLDSLKCPWVRLNGNHDGQYAVPDTCIARGNVHFILLDNVRRTRKAYEGGLNEHQKAWLDSVVRAIPEKDKVVLCAHIPFSQCKDREALWNILSGRRNLLLVCGHTHSVDRHILERGVEEVLAGAACGSWWRGPKDESGTPYALMNCGAPRGYFVADFNPGRRNWYSLSYKAVGRSDSASAFLRKGRLLVNVYGGSREGNVEIKCAGGRWRKLNHWYAIAPEVEDLIAFNSSRSREERKAHKEEFIPARRLPSPHIWAGDADGISQGSRIRIRYRDGAMSFVTDCTVQ